MLDHMRESLKLGSLNERSSNARLVKERNMMISFKAFKWLSNIAIGVLLHYCIGDEVGSG